MQWTGLLPLVALALQLPRLPAVSAYQDKQLPSVALWPAPAHATNGSTAVLVDACSFRFVCASSSDIAAAAAELYPPAVLFPMAQCRAQASRDPASMAAPAVGNLTLVVTNPSIPTAPPTAPNESYELSVAPDGSAMLAATTYFGLLRGLETFSQLLQAPAPGQADRGLYVIPDAPWMVVDRPSFPHRGLMLDPARTFLSPTTLRRTVDGMLYSKLNVLHLHLTDSQSFPLQLASYPNITFHGAYSAEEVYSAADMQQLVAYAARRGVRIVPEIDSPGHARAWGLAPELSDIVACADVPGHSYTEYCAEPPCGQLNPASELTYTVMEAVLKELAALFPDEYVHFGFDEINAKCWSDDPRIQAYMAAHNLTVPLLLKEYFVRQQALKAGAGGRRSIFWADVLSPSRSAALPLTADDVLQVWQNDGATSVSAALNNSDCSVIVSPADHTYLDCGLGNMFGDGSWCDPFKTWLTLYSTDPLSNVPPEDSARILGGEAAMWGELVSEAALDAKVWPRAAALGGRLWSHSPVLNSSVAEGALARHALRLRQRGLGADRIATRFCTIRPEMCY